MVTAATSDPITKPGIYPGLSFADYARIPAINGGALEHARTMAHLAEYLRRGDDSESEALDFGIALHAAALEPDRFDSMVGVGPINERTKEPYGRATKAFREWREANPGVVVIGPSDRERIQRMADSILRHKSAGELITRAGEREVTAVWKHRTPSGSLLCKGRMDLVCTGVSLVDLKTAATAAPVEFGMQAVRMGYIRKAAMYVDGWEAATGTRHDFAFIVVEKEPPYAVAVYAVPRAALEAGRAEYAATLARYARALKNNTFPAYPEDVTDLEVPGWYTRGFGEDL